MTLIYLAQFPVLASNLGLVTPSNGTVTLGASQISAFDLSLGAVAGTLPTAPPDRTQAGVRIIGTGVDGVGNPLPCIVSCGTGDDFTDESTSITLTTLGLLIWQYDDASNAWGICGGYTPPSVLAALFAPANGPTFQTPVIANSFGIAAIPGITNASQDRGTLVSGGAPATAPTDGTTWNLGDYVFDPVNRVRLDCVDPIANSGAGLWVGTGTAQGPTVTIQAITATTSTTLALSATVVPNGQATTYQFQLGTVTGGPYATQVVPASLTTVGSPGNDYTAYPVSATFTGLTAGTTYFVRCAGHNATTTNYSSEISGATQTAAAAPTVGSEGFTNLLSTSIIVNAFVSAQGGTSCTWQAQYSSNGGSTWNNVGSATALGNSGYSNTFVSQSITGLTPSTPYSYRITATNSVGGPVNGATQNITTPAAGLSPVVATVTPATSITQNTATISGSANPEGYTTTVQFDWGTSSSLTGSTRSAAQAAGAGTSSSSFALNLTGLTPGVQIYYRILATNANGTAFGTVQSFTALAAGTTPTNTVSPLISGSATVGGTLSVTDGTWSGTTPITYTQQWLQNGGTISGHTALTYSPVTADIGQAISCRITALNSIGTNTAIAKSVTVAGSSGSIVSGGLLDYSDISVSPGSPIINPKLLQQPFQGGAYHTALTSSTDAACQVLYNMADMPGLGLPKHARITTPVLRMTANLSDGAQAGAPTAPYGGVHQPNSSVSSSWNSPALFGGGGLFYIGWSLMWDPAQPSMGSSNQFQQFMEIFGSTVFGSPPIDMGVQGSGTGIPAASVESMFMGIMGTSNGGAGTGHWPWHTPMVRGSWIDFVLAINFSATGTVQLWMNGVAQVFNAGNPTGMTGWGTTTIGFNTINGNGTGPSNSNTLIIDNYRGTSWCTQSRLWNCGTKVGTSYSAVAP